MITLEVPLGARAYPIFIGEGLLGRGDLVAEYTAGRRVLIVSNETVAPLYMEPVREAFAGEVDTLVLPDGEQFKNLTTLNRIFDALLERRFARDCILVALGGGVIGDIVGFAAASYQRGVDFIQIPTTLLAQVDSSVGGKTGVNHALGKNMIGAFHQPRCVIADTATLDTLPPRELSAGIAEVIKYGLIDDAGFFAWLESNMPDLRQCDPAALAHAIGTSCAAKTRVVAADERETGRRALLNLGHTFGHAIEAGMGYGVWLHGEAVAAGMAQAADLSRRMGLLDGDSVRRIDALLASAALPTLGPAELPPERLLDLMAVDKKVQGSRIRLVLMRAIGKAFLTDRFDEQLLRETLNACRLAA